MEHLIYQISGGKNPKEYEFTTKAGITYACYFILAENLFSDYTDVASVFYLFNLDVKTGNARKQAPDEAIGNTVTFIIEGFLLQHTSAVVYVCDSSDERQYLRKRKFDIWFDRFTSSKILKIDSSIESEDYVVLNTLLVSRQHPLLESIIAAFISFNDTLKNK